MFSQFADRYVKSNTKKLGIVNREKFKKLLLKYFKYEFTNEEDLVRFSIDIFKKMKIKDDEDHYIKIRPEYKYDYMLITTNKTKSDIFKELSQIL